MATLRQISQLRLSLSLNGLQSSSAGSKKRVAGARTVNLNQPAKQDRDPAKQPWSGPTDSHTARTESVCP